MLSRVISFLLPLALFLIGASPSTQAKTILSAKYEGSYSGMSVKAYRKLTTDSQNAFKLETKISSLFASIHVNSDFVLNETAHIVPKHYHYKRKVFGVSKTEDIVFDWGKSKANYTNKKDPEKNAYVMLSKGYLDEPLVQLQIQRDMFSFSPNQTLNYTYVKPIKIKTQSFYFHETTTYILNGKTIDAIKLSTQPKDLSKETRKRSEKTTELWLAPQLNNQVVLIRHTDKNDDAYELRLTKYNADKKLLGLIYPAQTFEKDPVESVN